MEMVFQKRRARMGIQSSKYVNSMKKRDCMLSEWTLDKNYGQTPLQEDFSKTLRFRTA